MNFIICSNDFVWYDKILNFALTVLIAYLTYIMINFIYKAIKGKFESKKLIKIIIYTVIVFVIPLYLNMKYTVSLDYDDINKFGLCTDECVNINLTSSEKQDLLN